MIRRDGRAISDRATIRRVFATLEARGLKSGYAALTRCYYGALGTRA